VARPDSERTANLLVNAVLPPAAISIVSAEGRFPNTVRGGTILIYSSPPGTP